MIDNSFNVKLASFGSPSTLSPLVSAVERDEPKRLKQLLLENSCDQPVNHYGPQLLTKCLFLAAARGRVECVQILLEMGVPPDVRGDNNGNTPLIVATRGGEAEIVSALIAAGCDVNKPSNMARSRAIHWAASAADCTGSMRCMRQLLGAGADVEARVTSGRTPLMMAARAGHEEAISELISRGANVNATDHDRVTALHLAAQEGYDDCARCLVNAGSDVNAETRHGETPLSLAARNGHEDVVRLLVEVADAQTKPGNGSSQRVRRTYKGQLISPLHWAAAEGHERCVAILLTSLVWQQMADMPTSTSYESGSFVAPAGTTPLMLAAKSGCGAIVRELASRLNVEVDRADSDGMTAILYAVQADHYACVEHLLSAGANPDGVVCQSYRISPAVLAVTSGSVTSLRVLLQAGCRLDLPGRPGRLDDDANLLDFVASGRSPEYGEIQRLVSAALDLQDVALRRQPEHYTEPPCRVTSVSMPSNLHPTSLSNVCRQHVRRHLLKNTRRGGLFVCVPLLPLPVPLQRHLLLDELRNVN